MATSQRYVSNHRRVYFRPRIQPTRFSLASRSEVPIARPDLAPSLALSPSRALSRFAPSLSYAALRQVIRYCTALRRNHRATAALSHPGHALMRGSGALTQRCSRAGPSKPSVHRRPPSPVPRAGYTRPAVSAARGHRAAIHSRLSTPSRPPKRLRSVSHQSTASARR